MVRGLTGIHKSSPSFLGKLPLRVRLVVLLGTGDTYIAKTKTSFSKLYADFISVNPGS